MAGQRLAFDPNAPAADAEWIKHNLARFQASLPNGYCGRPPQQDCPHPNACLTCPDFQTTPTFLPLHRRQHDDTLELIDLAEKNGNGRLAANHRQVAANLQQVIMSFGSHGKRRAPPMSSEPPGLLAATQRRTADTRSRARSTIRRMEHEGRLINFVTVAREARISRNLLYRDPELRAEVERLRAGRIDNAEAAFNPTGKPGIPDPTASRTAGRNHRPS